MSLPSDSTVERMEFSGRSPVKDQDRRRRRAFGPSLTGLLPLKHEASMRSRATPLAVSDVIEPGPPGPILSVLLGMQFPEAPIPTPDERTNDALHEPFKRERFTQTRSVLRHWSRSAAAGRRDRYSVGNDRKAGRARAVDAR